MCNAYALWSCATDMLTRKGHRAPSNPCWFQGTLAGFPFRCQIFETLDLDSLIFKSSRENYNTTYLVLRPSAFGEQYVQNMIGQMYMCGNDVETRAAVEWVRKIGMNAETQIDAPVVRLSSQKDWFSR